MNAHFNKFIEPFGKGWRDPVFQWVINHFLPTVDKPRILTVGAERNMDVESRAGDGWADFYWAYYIAHRGGQLTIVDIEEDAIKACSKILSDFNDIDIRLVVGDGKEVIKSQEFDLIYLDGGPSPEEMLEQFELIDIRKTFVLFDDMGDKGLLLKEKYQHIIRTIQVNYIHQMAFYSPIFIDNKLEFLTKELYNNRIIR